MKLVQRRSSLVLSIFALVVIAAACAAQSSSPDASGVATDLGAGTESETPSAAGEPQSQSVTQQDPAMPPAPAPSVETRPAATPTRAPEPVPVQPEQIVVNVPAGTEIEVELADTLSSGTNLVGDPVRARLVRDLFADGELVAFAGAEVEGAVTEVVPLKNFGGQPSITFVLNRLELSNGTWYDVESRHTQSGKKQAGRDAAKIGGSAAAGAVIGHQVDDDKGTELGALVGGAIGTLVAAKTGKEVKIEAGSRVFVVLESDVQWRFER